MVQDRRLALGPGRLPGLGWSILRAGRACPLPELGVGERPDFGAVVELEGPREVDLGSGMVVAGQRDRAALIFDPAG
jgi:hypothetical protein